MADTTDREDFFHCSTFFSPFQVEGKNTVCFSTFFLLNFVIRDRINVTFPVEEAMEALKNLPDELFALLKNRTLSPVSVGLSGASVFCCEDAFLKIQPLSEEAENECAALCYLKNLFPVPECLFYGVKGGIAYLFTSRVSGKMACDPSRMKEPRLLTECLAEALKARWRIDPAGCPLKTNTEKKLRLARRRAEEGLVDLTQTDPDTFGKTGFRDPLALVEWLEDHFPEEDAVLSHGDFCLPNVFFDEKGLTGIVDLGRMGIADRWQDIALCRRSLIQSFRGDYTGVPISGFSEEMLFDALEIRPDPNKIRFFTLLDELF